MSVSESFPALVDVDWLVANLNQPDVVVLDASWHMPDEQRDGEAEWREVSIPGARFFDFDRKICDPQASLPHMLPDAAIFEREVRKLGVNRNSRIVVYDVLGVFSCVRAWWMLRAMGHEQVAVLNGGLPAWQRAGQAVAPGNTTTLPEEGNFRATFQPQWVRSAVDVQAALQDNKQLVVDARSAERFYGEVDEPRPGLLRGHMPGALNLPFVDLHNEQAGLRPADEIARAFAELGITDRDQPMIFSCGSGVTACVLALAAELAGFRHLSVYDGSWTEWGALDSGLPVV